MYFGIPLELKNREKIFQNACNTTEKFNFLCGIRLREAANKTFDAFE